jgi:hypothetical protein
MVGIALLTALSGGLLGWLAVAAWLDRRVRPLVVEYTFDIGEAVAAFEHLAEAMQRFGTTSSAAADSLRAGLTIGAFREVEPVKSPNTAP